MVAALCVHSSALGDTTMHVCALAAVDTKYAHLEVLDGLLELRVAHHLLELGVLHGLLLHLGQLLLLLRTVFVLFMFINVCSKKQASMLEDVDKLPAPSPARTVGSCMACCCILASCSSCCHGVTNQGSKTCTFFTPTAEVCMKALTRSQPIICWIWGSCMACCCILASCSSSCTARNAEFDH